jgi:hypothetical protein
MAEVAPPLANFKTSAIDAGALPAAPEPPFSSPVRAEALADGVKREALPLSPKTDSLETAAAATGNKLRVARAALEQLEAELAAARDRLTR